MEALQPPLSSLPGSILYRKIVEFLNSIVGCYHEMSKLAGAWIGDLEGVRWVVVSSIIQIVIMFK